MDFATDGTPRGLVGGKWFELRAEGWRELPTLDSKSEREFVLADVGGAPVTVPLAWADVKQVVRTTPATWVVTPTDVLRVRAGRVESHGWSGTG